MSNSGSMRLGGAGRGVSRGTAEGGVPKTFLMRRRLSDFPTAEMLADARGERQRETQGQELPARESMTVPSPPAQIVKLPVTVLEYR